MGKRRPLFLAILLFLIGCDSHPSKKSTAKMDLGPAKKPGMEEYLGTDSAFSRRVLVEYSDSLTLDFHIYQANAGCADSISGTAINQAPGMDPEISEDDSGEVYAATQYIDAGGECWVAVKIGDDKLTYEIAECKKPRNCLTDSFSPLARK